MTGSEGVLHDIHDRAGLHAALVGLDDTEIMARVRDVGVERVLERVFAVCAEVYDSSKGPSRPAIVRWDIGADGIVRHWSMRATRTGMECTCDDPRPAALTASLELPVFLRVMARVSHGAIEVAKGNIQFSGRLLLALELDRWFPAT